MSVVAKEQTGRAFAKGRPLRIGIDFDNTLVCYDGVFHKAALERGLIPADLASGKQAVRDYLRGEGREEDWIVLQGYVYGTRLDLASCYPGAKAFLAAARAAGHSLQVISHKTRHPFRGPQYDLHAAARAFLEREGLLEAEGACFELTKEAKLARIGAERCDLFIDDLPEFLSEPAFPESVEKFLFDPDGHHLDERRFTRVASWAALGDLLLAGAVQRC